MSITQLGRSALRTFISLLLLANLAGCTWLKGLWSSDDEDKDLEPAPLVKIDPEIKVRELWSTGIGNGQGFVANKSDGFFEGFPAFWAKAFVECGIEFIGNGEGERSLDCLPVEFKNRIFGVFYFFRQQVKFNVQTYAEAGFFFVHGLKKSAAVIHVIRLEIRGHFQRFEGRKSWAKGCHS